MKIFLLSILIPSIISCRNICTMNKLINDTEIIMNDLVEKISTEIQIMDIEVKMAIITESIHFQTKIDNHFKILRIKHLEQEMKFEALLSSIGLSPAREDEIYKIEEMEKVAKQGIINSIYE